MFWDSFLFTELGPLEVAAACVWVAEVWLCATSWIFVVDPESVVRSASDPISAPLRYLFCNSVTAVQFNGGVFDSIHKATLFAARTALAPAFIKITDLYGGLLETDP